MNVLDLAELRHVQIRDELVGICKAAGLKQAARYAAILHVMARWQAFKIKEFAEKRTRKQDGTLWFFMSAAQLHEELYEMWSLTVLRQSLVKLTQVGWLKRQKNPKNKRDNTYFYKLDAPAINKALWKWYEASENGECKGAIPLVQVSDLTFASSGFRATLPQSPFTEPLTQSKTQTAAVLKLIALGIEDAVAEALADKHSQERIEEVVRVASSKAKPAGYAVAMLENGWTVGKKAGGKKSVPWFAQSHEEIVQRYTGGEYSEFLQS